MTKYIDKSAKTEDEAIASALAELGLERDDVSVEILERAKSGFLGIGSSPAVVRVSYEAPDEVEPAVRAPEKKQAAREQAPAKQPERSASAEFVSQYVPQYTEGVKAETEAFVSGLLERMGVRANIEITDRENGGMLVNLSGNGMGAVIGRRGETLDAIQHLTNYVINKGGEKRSHISVDAEAYRAKREESLVSLANKMAAKVVKYKRSMALEPMNSYERYVIHTALQDYDGVSTNSTGVEPDRRVVVSYDRAKTPQQPAVRPAPEPAPAYKPAPVAQPAPDPEPTYKNESANKPESREWS